MADPIDQLQITYPGYERDLERWRRVEDVYKADIRQLRKPRHGDNYLKQRSQGESEDQYNERRDLADFTPIFSTIVNTYSGRIMGLEGQVDRQWTETPEEGDEGGGDAPEDILGSPDETGTIASKIWANTNGKGDEYPVVLLDAAALLIRQLKFYVVTEGIPRDEEGNQVGEASIKLVPPQNVVDKSYDRFGRLQWAKVKHRTDVRSRWKDEPDIRERYTIYQKNGYEVWELRKDEDGEAEEAVTVEEFQPYGGDEQDPFYYYRTAEGAARSQASDRILPIFEVAVPMKQHVGSILAEKNIILMNQESERDNILRVANTPQGVFAGTKDDVETWEELKDDGTNLWPLRPDASQKHYMMAPDTGPAEIATKVIREKVRHIFLSGFRFYEDAVKPGEMTARQVEQEAIPEVSFMLALAKAMDQMENDWFWRLEQINAPRNPEAWGQANVDRGEDVDPLNPEDEANRIMSKYFRAGSFPLTPEAKLELTKREYQRDGLPIDEEAILTEIENQNGTAAQIGDTVPTASDILRRNRGGPPTQAAEEEAERAAQEEPEGA